MLDNSQKLCTTTIHNVITHVDLQKTLSTKQMMTDPLHHPIFNCLDNLDKNQINVITVDYLGFNPPAINRFMDNAALGAVTFFNNPDLHHNNIYETITTTSDVLNRRFGFFNGKVSQVKPLTHNGRLFFIDSETPFSDLDVMVEGSLPLVFMGEGVEDYFKAYAKHRYVPHISTSTKQGGKTTPAQAASVGMHSDTINIHTFMIFGADSGPLDNCLYTVFKYNYPRDHIVMLFLACALEKGMRQNKFK